MSSSPSPSCVVGVGHGAWMPSTTIISHQPALFSIVIFGMVPSRVSRRSFHSCPFLIVNVGLDLTRPFRPSSTQTSVGCGSFGSAASCEGPRSAGEKRRERDDDGEDDETRPAEAESPQPGGRPQHGPANGFSAPERHREDDRRSWRRRVHEWAIQVQTRVATIISSVPLYMVYAKSSGVYTRLHILYRGWLLRPVPPTQWPHIGRSQRTTARRPTHVLTLADSKRLHYAVAPSEPRTAASAARCRRGLDHSCHPKDVMRLDGLRARQTTVKRPPRKT